MVLRERHAPGFPRLLATGQSASTQAFVRSANWYSLVAWSKIGVQAADDTRPCLQCLVFTHRACGSLSFGSLLCRRLRSRAAWQPAPASQPQFVVLGLRPDKPGAFPRLASRKLRATAEVRGRRRLELQNLWVDGTKSFFPSRPAEAARPY